MTTMNRNKSGNLIGINVTNKHFDTDIKRTFQYTRWLLEALGLWPMITKNTSIKSKIISKFVIIMCILAIAFTMVPATLHTFFREKNPVVKFMLAGLVTVSVTNFVKYFIIVFRTNTIKICIEVIEKDWMMIEDDNDRAIMTRNASVGRGITVMCSFFLYTGGMLYHAVLPILKGVKINQFNATIRPLVYPGYDIFVDPQTSPTYEIIFILICVSGLVRYTATIAVCNLAALFVTHACGQMEIVMSRLNRIFDGIVEGKSSIDIIEARTSFIIRCHARGLRLSSEIDRALRDIFLVEVVTATLIICLLSYFCMTSWDASDTLSKITYVLLLVSYIFNIFILCHIGELLKEKFQVIGKAAYMIEWYRFSGKNGLAIVLIMAMSNYPRKITAGRMMELSVCSFGIIIKTALAYLNMLRAIAD